MHLILSTHQLGDLPLLLDALLRGPARPDTLVVSVDGIRPDVAACAANFRSRSPIPLLLVQRPFAGTARRGQTRNNGVRALNGRLRPADMLYFLDGDVWPDRLHLESARRARADVVIGRVIRLPPADSDRIRNGRPFQPGWPQRTGYAMKTAKAKIACALRGVPGLRARIPLYWPDLRSGNVAVRACSFIRVNGFDESMTGWGLEDSDLGLRLYRAGARVRTFPWRALAYHLWHPSGTGGGKRTPSREWLAAPGFRPAHGLDNPYQQAAGDLRIDGASSSPSGEPTHER